MKNYVNDNRDHHTANIDTNQEKKDWRLYVAHESKNLVSR